jgi:hypothetical protein
MAADVEVGYATHGEKIFPPSGGEFHLGRNIRLARDGGGDNFNSRFPGHMGTQLVRF